MADLAAFMFDRRKSGDHQGRHQIVPDAGRNGIECPFPTLALIRMISPNFSNFPRCSPESGSRMERASLVPPWELRLRLVVFDQASRLLRSSLESGGHRRHGWLPPVPLAIYRLLLMAYVPGVLRVLSCP